MTEYTLEREAEAAVDVRAETAQRVVNLVAGLLLVVWSWKWLPPMLAGVRAQTELGRNGLTILPSAHQVFEVLFVAAHWGVKWLPGVVLVGVIAGVARRLVRRLA